MEYQGEFGIMEMLVMSDKMWNNLISWLGKHIKELALATCEQVRSKVIE